MEYTVNFNWDSEAGVWTAICDDIPLALESGSFDALVERAKICAAEMLELNSPQQSPVKLRIKSERLESIA